MGGIGREWAAEFTETALLLFAVVTAKDCSYGTARP
jgi:hypothetical protein